MWQCQLRCQNRPGHSELQRAILRDHPVFSGVQYAVKPSSKIGLTERLMLTRRGKPARTMDDTWCTFGRGLPEHRIIGSCGVQGTGAELLGQPADAAPDTNLSRPSRFVPGEAMYWKGPV